MYILEILSVTVGCPEALSRQIGRIANITTLNHIQWPPKMIWQQLLTGTIPPPWGWMWRVSVKKIHG